MPNGLLRSTDPTPRDPSQFRWWEETNGKTLARKVFLTHSQVVTQQASRLAELARFRRLYVGARSQQAGLSMAAALMGGANPRRVAFNIIASAIDTLTSKITGNRVRPMYLTSGGDRGQQRQAQAMEKFTDGQFYEHQIYRKGPLIFRDGCVFSDGWLMVLPDRVKKKGDKGSIEVRRCDPASIAFDDADALRGDPQQMFYATTENLDDLNREYPTRRDVLRSAVAGTSDFGWSRSITQRVDLLYAWKRPHRVGGEGGRFVICTKTGVLDDRPWTRGFPFASFRPTKGLDGVRGIAVSDRLYGYQLEVNKVSRVIQMSHHLVSVPRVFVEEGSNVVGALINNEIGELIKYTGTKPIFEAAAAVSPELALYLKDVIAGAFNEVGISMMSAASQKPPGLNAAVALRTMVDIESDRFKDMGHGYEDFTLDTADLLLQAAREIHDAGGEVIVRSPGRNKLDAISMKDIAGIKPDQYITQCYPSNLLPTLPEGRLQMVTDLAESQLMPPEFARKLLDFPDVDRYMSLSTAWIDEAEAAIEKMLDGQPQMPERYENLSEAAKLVQSAYLRARADGIDEDRLGLLLNWLSDAEDMQAQVMAAQSSPIPAGPVPGAAPQAPVGQMRPALRGAA